MSHQTLINHQHQLATDLVAGQFGIGRCGVLDWVAVGLLGFEAALREQRHVAPDHALGQLRTGRQVVWAHSLDQDSHLLFLLPFLQ